MADSTRVLVTGGAGFIGSHIVDAMVAGGYRVAVIDSLVTGDAGNLHVRDRTGKAIRAGMHMEIYHAGKRIPLERGRCLRREGGVPTGKQDHGQARHQRSYCHHHELLQGETYLKTGSSALPPDCR